MSKETHYQALGIPPTASDAEIKRAYRAMALKWHPDRNADPAALDRFHRITEAYGALIDPIRRASYDRLLNMEQVERASKPKTPPKNPPTPGQPAPPKPKPQARRVEPQPEPEPVRPPTKANPDDIVKLTALLTRGRFSDAERLARRLIGQNTLHPIPYAVMGDIARMRGELTYAAEMYAYAIQMDPRNPIYQRKHEETLSMSQRAMPRIGKVQQKQEADNGAMFVAAFVVLASAAYVALSKDRPLAAEVTLINTWTWSLLAMSALCGATLGAAMSVGGLLDRFNASFASGSVMPISPGVLVGCFAAVNYWLAVLVYVIFSGLQNTFHSAANHLLTGVGLVVMVLSGAAAAQGQIDPLQTFLWSGSVVYCCALIGWLGADSYLESTGRLK